MHYLCPIHLFTNVKTKHIYRNDNLLKALLDNHSDRLVLRLDMFDDKMI